MNIVYTCNKYVSFMFTLTGLNGMERVQAMISNEPYMQNTTYVTPQPIHGLARIPITPSLEVYVHVCAHIIT